MSSRPRIAAARGPGPGRWAVSTLVVLALFFTLLLAGLVRLGSNGPGRGDGTHIGVLLATSLVTALLSTVLALAIGVPAAYALARRAFPGRRLVSTLLDVPTMLSPVAIGIALLLFLRDPPGAWLDRSTGVLFALPGVVLAQFTIIVALVVRSAEAAFASADPRMERLAELHGASRRAIFTRVTLPSARGGLTAAAILAFARAFGEFGATAMVAGTIPGRTETLATGIFVAVESGNLALAARLGLVLVLVAGTVLLVLRRVGGSRT